MKKMMMICGLLLLAVGYAQGEKRNVGYFTEIEARGAADIVFTQDKSTDVSVDGDAASVAATKTRVIGNKLLITSRRSKNGGRVTVRITAPDLYDLEMVGAGSFTTTKKLSVWELDVENRGAGSCNLGTVDCNDLSLDNKGAGSISVDKVSAKEVSMDNSGAGKIEIKKLDSNELDVENNGAGNVKLYKVTVKDAELENTGVGEIEFSSTNSDHVECKNHGRGYIRLRGKIAYPEISAQGRSHVIVE